MKEYIFDIEPEIAFDLISLEGFSNAFLKNAKEEIVRCCDCEYYVEHQGYATCEYFDRAYAEVEPDGFCAWGIRGKQ